MVENNELVAIGILLEFAENMRQNLAELLKCMEILLFKKVETASTSGKGGSNS